MASSRAKEEKSSKCPPSTDQMMDINHFFAAASGRGMQGNSNLYHCLLSLHRMHFFLARISWLWAVTLNLHRSHCKIRVWHREPSSEEYSFWSWKSFDPVLRCRIFDHVDRPFDMAPINSPFLHLSMSDDHRLPVCQLLLCCFGLVNYQLSPVMEIGLVVTWCGVGFDDLQFCCFSELVWRCCRQWWILERLERRRNSGDVSSITFHFRSGSHKEIRRRRFDVGLGVCVWRLLFDCLSCLLMKSMGLQRLLLNRLCYQQASFHPRKHLAKVLQRKHRGCHRRVISSQHLCLPSFKLMSHLQLQSLRQDLKFHPRHMEPCQYPSGKFSCYPSDTQMLSDQRGGFHLH